MFEKILRALGDAVSGSGDESDGPSGLTWYRWRCPCGAESRSGWNIELDANYNAERHMWREGVGHPMPDVYSTVE